MKNICGLGLIFFLMACANLPKEQINSASQVKPLPGKMQLFSSGVKQPWIGEKEKRGQLGNLTVLFFNAAGEEKTLEQAKQKAEALQETAALNCFKDFFTKQIKEIFKQNSRNPEPELAKIKLELERYQLPKEKSWAIKKIDQWWEHYSEPKIEKEQVAGWTAPQFKYHVRWVIHYQSYQRLRTDFLKELKKKWTQDLYRGDLLEWLPAKLEASDQEESAD